MSSWDGPVRFDAFGNVTADVGPRWIAGVDFTLAPPGVVLTLNRGFGALEYFEGGARIIEDGPTPSELAAIESLVSARSSRCMPGPCGGASR